MTVIMSDSRTADIQEQVDRLKTLIEISIHLLPDSPCSFEHEEKLFAVLVAAQELVEDLLETVSVSSQTITS